MYTSSLRQVSLFGAIASILFLSLSAGAGRGANRKLTGTVSPADSTCNQSTNPGYFVVDQFEEVDLELTMPAGSSILGWDCRNNVCTRTVAVTDSVAKVIVIDNGDPSKLGGSTFALILEEHYLRLKAEAPDGNVTLLQFWGSDFNASSTLSNGDPDPDPCCTCPCSFSTTC